MRRVLTPDTRAGGRGVGSRDVGGRGGSPLAVVGLLGEGLVALGPKLRVVVPVGGDVGRAGVGRALEGTCPVTLGLRPHQRQLQHQQQQRCLRMEERRGAERGRMRWPPGQALGETRLWCLRVEERRGADGGRTRWPPGRALRRVAIKSDDQILIDN